MDGDATGGTLKANIPRLTVLRVRRCRWRQRISKKVD